MAESKIKANRPLLWTNPNPNSSFGAQTISLDLTNYKAVEIVCKTDATSFEETSAICDKGFSVMVSRLGGGNGYGSGGVFLVQRMFTVTNNGVTALRGLGGFAADDNFPYSNDSRMIPYKIYGIY